MRSKEHGRVRKISLVLLRCHAWQCFVSNRKHLHQLIDMAGGDAIEVPLPSE